MGRHSFVARVSRLLAAVLALACAASLPAAPRYMPLQPGVQRLTPPSGVPVQVTVEQLFPAVTSAGFFSLRIAIRNDSPTELAWNATLGTSSWGVMRWSSDESGRPPRFETEAGELRVPAGTSREFVLQFPVPGAMPYACTVTGPYVEEVSLNLNLTSNTHSRVVQTLAAREWMAPLTLPAERTRAGRGAPSANAEAVSWERTRFPEDWRTLTMATGVALTSEDWSAFSPAQREALRGYLVRGGHLDFVSAKGAVAPFTLPAELGGHSLASDGARRSYGLGLVSAGYFSSPQRHGLAWWGIWPDGGGDFEPANSPDRLDGGLPRWTLFGVLALSAALSGPVTLFWFARRRGRHWLFVALPGVAVGSTLVLSVVITVRDGFGGSGSRHVLAVLADGRPELAVRQLQLVRCGLVFQRAFQLPEETMMELASHPNTAVDLFVRRDGSQFEGDWFRNRTTSFHALTAVVSSRAELRWLEPANASGAPRVLSSFGGPLRELIVNRQGRWWFAEEVAPGMETALRPLSRRELEPHLEAARKSPNAAIGAAARRLETDDGFLARAEQLEGVPVRTLASVRWRDQVFVAGRCTTGGVR